MACSSSSELEAMLCKKEYDVFINHRGPDVKETLAFALYDALEEKGCSTFLDDEELQLGDSIFSAIQEAIYSSKVQIAIFSPRYVESSWCLDELLLMLESKARFIPIFCDVKPSDLRYPDKEGSCYAPAFAIHEQKMRFSQDKLDQWKAALHSSSLISGYHFTTSHDNVERLCTRITLAVQQEVGKLNVFHEDAAPSTSRSVEIKKSSLLPRDSHPVGLQSKVEEIQMLVEEPQVPVIAVVGMGGSGKTFLLQNVYKALKFNYAHSIWLSISRSYSLKTLQHDIASHIGLRREIVDGEVSEERAAELIQEHLQGKRCLIVLDDLWTLSTENSLIDKLGLPADKDCKVVVTTRNRQVALNSGAQIYEMQNLSDEDSWRLFCIYAFPKGVRNRGPRQVEEEGRKIVKQCGNLPLALKTIAASLANTTLVSKWELKRRHLERVATPIGDPVMEILRLSYDSLPPHLKPCFAYLSFFPEDAKIEAEYLINLWIGEGLVPGGEEQWDMARDWLDQLAQLCLLQVDDEDIDFKGCYDRTILIKYCKIHDLLHDLAIHISKEEKCVFSVEEISTQKTTSGWRRILLAKKGLHEFSMSDNHPLYLRTLTLSENEEITSIPASLFRSMRGLRVLDLSDTKISTLPASLGKMVLLRVLNLNGTWIRELPECVRHLRSLVFLALPRHCRSLPVWITELTCLQHIGCSSVQAMPKQISKLPSLRTLRSSHIHFSIQEDCSAEEGKLVISREEEEVMRLEDLVKIRKLQEVRIRVGHEKELKKMEEGILAQLVNMRHLHIVNDGKGPPPQISDKMREMKHLESLRLRNFDLPSWIHELANLRELVLTWFRWSDLSELQEMPNLVVLKITDNSRSIKFSEAFGRSGGFSQLRFLYLAEFCSLEEFPKLEDGAMACLQQFKIINCPRLKKVDGLERLKRLEWFYCFSSEPMNEWWWSLREGGEYWNKIKVISPHIGIQLDMKISHKSSCRSITYKK